MEKSRKIDPSFYTELFKSLSKENKDSSVSLNKKFKSIKIMRPFIRTSLLAVFFVCLSSFVFFHYFRNLLDKHHNKIFSHPQHILNKEDALKEKIILIDQGIHVLEDQNKKISLKVIQNNYKLKHLKAKQKKNKKKLMKLSKELNLQLLNNDKTMSDLKKKLMTGLAVLNHVKEVK